MPAKFNRRRTLLVLGKIDEILAWEQRKEARRPRGTPSSWNWDAIYARCGRDSTGGRRN
jgi:hypothetical protein